MAVAQQESQATVGQVGLMVLLDGVGDESEAGAVLFAMPPRAVGADSLDKGLIDFSVGERLSFPIIPAGAGEGSQKAG
jgi:hypothetical protein